MAELTPLDVKLGEVLGLAQAAQEATEAVARLAAEHDDSVRRLETMRREEAETERRTLALLDRLGGQRPEAEAKGNEARTGAYEMMRLYLDEAADELAGVRVPHDGRGRRARPLGDHPRDERAHRRLRRARAGRVGHHDPGAPQDLRARVLARAGGRGGRALSYFVIMAWTPSTTPAANSANAANASAA